MVARVTSSSAVSSAASEQRPRFATPRGGGGGAKDPNHSSTVGRTDAAGADVLARIAYRGRPRGGGMWRRRRSAYERGWLPPLSSQSSRRKCIGSTVHTKFELSSAYSMHDPSEY